MYKVKKNPKTTIVINQSYEGETIEQKMQRVVNNGEPITDGAPVIYTERKDGVLPEYDVRTDTWDIAVEAMDVVAKTAVAKRMDGIQQREEAKIVKLPENEEGKSNEKGGA